MLKQLLNMFNREASNCRSKEELNGYFYASYDMLFVLACSNFISQCAYEYLLKKMERARGFLMFEKFQDVGYLRRLEEVGRL